jgi:hypothetical protein
MLAWDCASGVRCLPTTFCWFSASPEKRHDRSDHRVGHKAGDQAGYRLLARDLYNALRMAWERGVEEVLFHEVVLRFRKGVETSRLKKVTVEPEDVTDVTSGMARCSNYTGHDGAQEANVAPPSPVEMEADINALEAWRKFVVARPER